MNWITDHLEDRQQRVIILSYTSNYKTVSAGVPQVSVLGPLLFLIYINDIAGSLLSLTRLFADDSSLFYSASSILDIEGIINHDLQLLAAWAKQWLIKFNLLKTEAILFTLRQSEAFPKLIFENTQLRFVDCHKHLRVTLNLKGQWHDHIEKVVKSAAKIIGIMRKLKYTLSRIALNQKHFSYVFPVLEYSSIVWDGCSQHDSSTLEKLQHEAARIVSGLTISVSLENLYRECGWIPLSESRRQQKLTFMYQTTRNFHPLNLS